MFFDWFFCCEFVDSPSFLNSAVSFLPPTKKLISFFKKKRFECRAVVNYTPHWHDMFWIEIEIFFCQTPQVCLYKISS